MPTSQLERSSRKVVESANPFPLRFSACIAKHAEDRSIVTRRVLQVDGDSGEATISIEETEWVIRWALRAADVGELEDLDVTFELTKGKSRATSVGVELTPSAWGVDRYVTMPGAVYAGNRFESRKQPYPPMFSGEDARVDVPILISDVPRLHHVEGERSHVTLPTHDLTTPALGIFDPTSNSAVWVLTQQRTRFGTYGISVDESSDRSAATIRVMALCVREGRRDWATWSDRAPDWDANAANRLLHMTVRLCRFDCDDIVSLFERFGSLRTSLVPDQHNFDCAPLSGCAAVLEKKFNDTNWCETPGCFATKPPEVNWQLGWVNGLVTSYGMLVCGDAVSQSRALRTLDFALSSQCNSGFLRGYYREGAGWIGDGFERPGTKHWAMVRKEADGLYFGMKHLLHLEARSKASSVKPAWKSALSKLADAFVNNWKRYAEYGQFVDEETGEIVVGNSTAGGLVPAGLALAGRYLERHELIETADVSACAYYDRWTARGLTVGGPGEILATPDSESAMALLESFVTLYEITRDRSWLTKASAAADQLASWVVSYPFEFPPESTLGRLRANATGTVVANSQNKHSAPGLCTFSGDALFRLFRATGKARHLELLRDIAGTFPQFLSRADRIIGTSPPGVICERVNLSDWEGDHRVGDVPPWSCWCESALLLTCAEVPGVYVQPDIGYVMALDNIQALTLEEDSTRLKVLLINSTPLDASVRVVAEDQREAETTIFDDAARHSHTKIVHVPAGGKTFVVFPKSEGVRV